MVSYKQKKLNYYSLDSFIISKIIVNKQELPDFVQYTMQNVVPCCFQNFIKPNIDLNDAQQVLVSFTVYLTKI